MMFGMGQEGTTNLITKALSAVGKRLDTVPDPTQIHYHLPPSKAHPEVSPGASQDYFLALRAAPPCIAHTAHGGQQELHPPGKSRLYAHSCRIGSA